MLPNNLEASSLSSNGSNALLWLFSVVMLAKPAWASVPSSRSLPVAAMCAALFEELREDVCENDADMVRASSREMSDGFGD